MDRRFVAVFIVAASVVLPEARAADGLRGIEDVRAAMTRGLEWLARNQSEAGNWEVKRWGGRHAEEATVGVTGLALLAFLRGGSSQKSGPFKATVAKALAYLVSRQAQNGSIGDNASARTGGGYNHGMAGLALAEAYGMSRDGEIREAAQRAVAYSIDVHQGPRGGWRYSPGMKGDTSVTGWYVTQLKSAISVGLEVPPAGFQGAIAFLIEKVTDMRTGRAAYTPGGAQTPSMTAIAMHCLQCMGWKRDDPPLVGGAAFLLRHPPAWNAGGRNDSYYWYWGTLAMYPMGGRRWEAWSKSLHKALLRHQHHTPSDPKLDGSWDPIGQTGMAGGRACVTALGCLTLEIAQSQRTHYR